jgi:hypothetical protein
MAGTENALEAAHMGALQRLTHPPSPSPSQDHPPVRILSEALPVRNRMREICTFGSVRGEGGNILTYSAIGIDRRLNSFQQHKYCYDAQIGLRA